MNNILMPEQRPDRNGRVVTRWTKPQQQLEGRERKFPSPEQTAAPQKAVPASKQPKERPTRQPTQEQSRSLYERLIDSIVSMLLGPEKDSKISPEAREAVRERIAVLPERTVRNLEGSWEKAKTWAEGRLDETEFGRFSERLRGEVQTLLNYDPYDNSQREQAAQDIDAHAERVRRETEQAEREYAAQQNQDPLIGFMEEQEAAEEDGDDDYSSLDDLMGKRR